MTQFNGKLLIIGCGAVAQCSIRLIVSNIQMDIKKISIIDPIDNRAAIADLIEQGVQFKIKKITKENYAILLSQHLSAGDICLDLANQVSTEDILRWCQDHHILYLNTCLNLWPNTKLSVHELYKTALKLQASFDKKITAILSHGANPGLISSFVKQGLLDYAQYTIEHNQHDQLADAVQHKDFKHIAAILDLKTIHVAEKDTQTIPKNGSTAEFLNTWSTVEFIHECISLTQFAWGTHETDIPTDAYVIDGNIFFKQKGLELTLKSWVPYEEYRGMLIPHDETFMIADYLSIPHNGFMYRPTVVFVYDPCPAAKLSLQKLVEHKFKHLTEHVIVSEIASGIEKMGCLLLTPYGSWWTGSVLNIEEAHRILPHQNSTIMQVAAGVLAGLKYLMQHPHEGILFPEQLDHHQVLATAKAYLGEFISEYVGWNPSQTCEFKDYI